MRPLALSRCASLPTVVVLPVPLTPTAKITNGRCAVEMVSGASTVQQARRRGLAQQLDRRRAELRLLAARISPTSHVVASTPTSAGQQSRLRILDRRFVERLPAEAEQLGREPSRAAVQPRFELAEKTRALFVGRGGHACEIPDDVLLLV